MLKHLTVSNVLDIAAKGDAKRAVRSQHEQERRAAKGTFGMGFGNLPSLEEVFGAETLTRNKAADDVVDALSHEQLRELAALLWLGRGDHATWEEALRHAVNTVTATAPSYLIDRLDFSQWLRDGLAKVVPAE